MARSNRVLFYLGHPAHFHLFKWVIQALMDEGVPVLVIIKRKDVLEELVKRSGFGYKVLPGNLRTLRSLQRLVNVYRLLTILFWVIRYKVGVMVSSGAEPAMISKVLKSKVSLIYFEDDLQEVPLYAKLVGPTATRMFCPVSCSGGDWDFRCEKYESYHELAYLHPSRFEPDKNCVEGILDLGRKNFILRFSDLSAYHDVGKAGLSDQLALQIIEKLEPHGKVLITSERKLSSSLEKYRINISPELIHHALFFADGFIGDSQTMTAECAVLGTPSIRYNDFVGKLGYLEELEWEFQLTKGIRKGDEQQLIDAIDQMLLKTEPVVWDERRTILLNRKVDLNTIILEDVRSYLSS